MFLVEVSRGLTKSSDAAKMQMAPYLIANFGLLLLLHTGAAESGVNCMRSSHELSGFTLGQ